MKLTPGQLYFINEQDVRTGERSNYYKIGIVRESDVRDSKDRLLEHQTGNPRKLCVVETLNMPAVEYIETNLHYLFARNRVMGEWMEFSDVELKAAIAKANELKTEMEENLPLIKQAEELKSIVSSGSKIQPTDEHLSLHEQYLTYKEIVSSCEFALEKYDKYLIAAIEKGVAAPGAAKIQERAGARTFDEKLFAETYPELYEQYAQSKTKITGKFLVTTPKDWTIDVSAMPSEQVELISNFLDGVETADQSLETGFMLHEKHLAVLEMKQYAEYNKVVVGTKLRVQTGESDGIEGICSWRRRQEISINLDKKNLQKSHPIEYESCVIEGTPTIALLVEPKLIHSTE